MMPETCLPTWRARMGRQGTSVNSRLFSTRAYLPLASSTECALHRFAGAGFDIGEAQIFGALTGHASKLVPAEDSQHADTIDDPVLLLAGKAFGDGPLPATRLGLSPRSS